MEYKLILEYLDTDVVRPKWDSWLSNNQPELKEWLINQTSIYTSNIVEAVYIMLNDAPTICENGNKPKFGSFKHGYAKFCQKNCKCSRKHMSEVKLNRTDEERINALEKAKKTNLERHGVENSAQSPILRERAHQTNLARYGVRSASQSPIFLEKTKQTSLERYGVENASQSPVLREKAHQTNIERYGVRSAAQSPIFKEKTKQTNLRRYGFDHQCLSLEVLEKAKKTNLERYGVEYSGQSAEVREKGRATNLEKYGVPTYSAVHLSPEQYANLHNKNWFIVAMQTMSFSEIAKQLNVTISTVYKQTEAFKLRPNLGSSRSQGEVEVGNYIKSLGFEIITNDRTIIKPKELDIVIPSAKLAIEYCGLYWHSDEYLNDNYHQSKLNRANSQGYQLITIFEDEWNNKSNIVKSTIRHKLMIAPDKVFARKTIVKQIFDSELIKQFYDINHIQGYIDSTITYGLIHNDMYVAMMSFKENQLTRYATSMQVISGASKLLNYFWKNNQNYTQVVSFADLRWSNGNLYEKLGFTLSEVMPPEDMYIRDTTEQEVPKIWDCGKLKYIQSK